MQLTDFLGRQNPHLLILISEVVINLNLNLSAVIIEQDLGPPVGYSDHAKIHSKDTIFYARMNKLSKHTRFVRRRKAEQTTYITFKLQLDSEDNYELLNAWIGKIYPPVPGDANVSQESKDYWANHAVIFNGQSPLGSTVTKICPY